MATGTIKWFNPSKGFGWIRPDDGSFDVFFHFTAIKAGWRPGDDLTEGQSVSFEKIEGPKSPQATTITVFPR